MRYTFLYTLLLPIWICYAVEFDRCEDNYTIPRTLCDFNLTFVEGQVEELTICFKPNQTFKSLSIYDSNNTKVYAILGSQWFIPDKWNKVRLRIKVEKVANGTFLRSTNVNEGKLEYKTPLLTEQMNDSIPIRLRFRGLWEGSRIFNVTSPGNATNSTEFVSTNCDYEEIDSKAQNVTTKDSVVFLGPEYNVVMIGLVFVIVGIICMGVATLAFCEVKQKKEDTRL